MSGLRAARGVAFAMTLVATSIAACEAVLGVDGLEAAAGGVGGTASGSSSSSSGGFARPPAPGPLEAPDGGSSVTFAFTHVYFGDTNLDGGTDANAWEQFGYNIDGIQPENTGAFCMAVDGAPAGVHQEGINGIQNAFGHVVVQLLVELLPNFSMVYNQSLTNGDFTYLLTLNDLGSAADANPIVASFALGGSLADGGMAELDGGDAWPVVKGTSFQFPSSYVVGNTWVSGSPIDITLSLRAGPFSLQLPVHHMVASMRLDAAHQTATDGVLSGIVPTAELVAQVQALAGLVDPTNCTNQTAQGIFRDIAGASDILEDGTQNHTQTCNGITIGLGFTAAAAKVGPMVDAPAPAADPCLGKDAAAD